MTSAPVTASGRGSRLRIDAACSVGVVADRVRGMAQDGPESASSTEDCAPEHCDHVGILNNQEEPMRIDAGADSENDREVLEGARVRPVHALCIQVTPRR